MPEIVKVYIKLPEEETPCARGTDAIPMGGGLYQILSTPYFNPEDEVWEFLPGSIVRVERKTSGNGEEILLAVEKVG